MGKATGHTICQLISIVTRLNYHTSASATRINEVHLEIVGGDTAFLAHVFVNGVDAITGTILKL